MNNKLFACIALSSVLALGGCSAPKAVSTAAEGSGTEAAAKVTDDKQKTEAVEVKTSNDPHIQYIKNYVGMNVGSTGYTALNGFRCDRYGNGFLKLVFVDADGTYLDPQDEAQLKQYVITSQDLKPNTEVKFSFLPGEDGEESSLVASQSYEEIVLGVKKVGAKDAKDAKLSKPTEASPDKYTRYVKSYIGRNLASCGYLSLAGKWTDQYGLGYVTFDIVTSDGSYVDVTNKEELAKYRVTEQSIPVDTPITMTFQSDENGDSTLVSSQSVTSITLTVEKVDGE